MRAASGQDWGVPGGRQLSAQFVAQQGASILESLGNLGDFISGIGVVATLIYLAVQVRQNTAALKTASRQAIVAGMREHNPLALEPGGETFLRASESYPNVPEDERRYYTARLNDLLLFFQGAHALHGAGTLEDQTYGPYLDFVAASLATPGGNRYSQQVSGIFTPRMVAAPDARLKRGDLLNLLQVASAAREPAAQRETAAPEPRRVPIDLW